MQCLRATLCRRATRHLFASKPLARDFTIAIDGPAASGKSSTARAVALELGFGYIDSGSIYRCATLLALRHDITDISAGAPDLIDLINKASVDIKFQPQSTRSAPNLITGRLPVPDVRILLNDEDVSEEIRKPDVNRLVAKVASDGGVRSAVLGIQRALARAAETRSKSVVGKEGVSSVPGGVVMDGRDIGTTIFPNAELKIYLDASAMARAIRRWDEMNSSLKRAKPPAVPATAENTPAEYPSVEDIARELEERDYADINRQHSPLRIAKDAIVIDNTSMTFEQQVYSIADLARDRMGLERKHDDL
ncbi:hypothetical protein H4S07_003861 [Coemansia furcata]|uniref:Uncharacterized protein n=1 Tax=Coemansia furcata TaxID=417177 RepID=A0ACC1LEW0_9FUNG|nr:hypothetical protein H4S07_003861 [Coemansia furcata]